MLEMLFLQLSVGLVTKIWYRILFDLSGKPTDRLAQSPTISAISVGEDAVKIVYSGGYDRLEVQKRRTTPTPPMSAPGGLARRFWSDASANHMSVTSLREYSPPNIMARHRTLRRAMASASKMPSTCISVSVRARVLRGTIPSTRRSWGVDHTDLQLGV